MYELSGLPGTIAQGPRVRVSAPSTEPGSTRGSRPNPYGPIAYFLVTARYWPVTKHPGIMHLLPLSWLLPRPAPTAHHT